MHRIIAIAFSTLDGVVEDPDGSFGSPVGGWALRAGPQAFAGDKFALGSLMETGTLLVGRRTWELFADRWPDRRGGFADAMNAVPKLVASRTLADVSAWPNSKLVDGDLDTAIERARAAGPVIVAGSTSIVHGLAHRGMVDEYRLRLIPATAGDGARVFAADAPPQTFQLAGCDAADGTVLLRYERAAASPDGAAG